jgi:hypothetical protein
MPHATTRRRSSPAKASCPKKGGHRGGAAAVQRQAGSKEQASLGGQYAAGPVHRLGIQTKLTVGRAGDSYEREADKVAERVASGQPVGDVSRIPAGGLAAQRKEGDAPEEMAQSLAQREDDAGEGDGAATAQRMSDEGVQQKSEEQAQAKSEEKTQQKSEEKAQRQEDEGGKEEDAQAKCDQCEKEEKAQRQDEGDTPDAQAQRQDDKGEVAEEDAQTKCAACRDEDHQSVQRQSVNTGGAASSDSAQAAAGSAGEKSEVPVQRQEEGGQEAASEGGEEGTAQPASGADPAMGPECDPADAGESEEAAAPEQEEHGEELGCGESEGEGGAEGGAEGAAPAAAEGGQSCGGGEETAAEGTEAGGAGPTESEPSAEADPDPGAGAPVPGCAAATVEAAGSSPGESHAESAPATGEGGGQESAASECGTAQRKEDESAGDEPDTAQAAQRQEDEGGSDEATQLAQREEGESGGDEPDTAQAAQRQEDEGDSDEATQLAQREEDESGSDEAAQTRRSSDPVKREGLDTGTASRLIHARGAGEPLKPNVKHRLEHSLGVDVNGIRVHSDGNAQAANRALRAKAFTHRNHIFLGAGQSQHDMSLMAHEGTHVLQQEAIARRKPEQTEPSGPARPEGESAAGGESATAAPASPVPASGEPAKVAKPGGAAPAAPSPEPTPAAAAPPRGGAQPLAPPVPPPGATAAPLPAPALPPAGIAGPQAATAPALAAAEAPAPASRGTTAPSPAVAAAPGTAAKAAAMPARPHAAAPSVSGAVSGADVAPARAPEVSIAQPDPSAFTGEPSGSLAALAALSPVRAPFAYQMFRAGVGGSLERRRRSEHAERPHGRYQVRSPNLPGGRPERSSPALGPAPAAPQPALTPGAAPVKVEAAPEATGPAPAIDTAAKEREIDAINDKKPNVIERLRAWLLNFFAGLPTSDPNVNTDMGPKPELQSKLAEETDPAQIQTIEDESNAKAAHNLEEADEERDDDFGEQNVEPEQEDGEVEIPVPPHVHKMGTGCDPEADAEPLSFDPPHEAELAERVHAKTGARWTAEADRLDTAEGQRDSTITSERTALPGRIAAAHGTAYREEDEAAATARTEVERLREDWGTENRGVQTRFEGESGKQAVAQRGEIAGHIQTEQGLVDERHKTDQAEADLKNKAVQEKVKRENEDAERKAKSESSGSWFSRGVSWVAGKVKGALAWAAKKIKGWVSDLRAWLRKKFDEFKKWVNEKIEAARRWINERLEGLRRRLHALVDKYLGEYPEIAKRFHKAIDTKIDAAQAAVNRAADRLKKSVNALIDAVADAVDTALAVVEKVVVWALTVACDLIVTGLNLLNVLVEGDLDSMIKFVRELPDWPPIFGGLMSMVRAGMLGFLETIRDTPIDKKKRFVEKIRGLATSGRYYGGVFLGILNGLVVEGLVGTIKMIYDIITSLPDIISGIYDAIKKLATDVEAIEAIVDSVNATRAEVEAFLKRPDAADELIAMLKRSPQILVSMIEHALHEGREWAYREGAKVARDYVDWIINKSNYEIGLAVGTFVGRVIFEVILLVFTAGAGTAVKWGGKALQWLLRGVRTITTALGKGGGLIMKGLNLLREIVMVGVRAAQKLGRAFKKILSKVGEVVDRIVNWFKRAFGKVGRKLARKVSPKELERWAAFKLEVKEALAGHLEGMTKGEVQGRYRRIITLFRDVVGWPTVITKSGPYWRLWARPKKGLRPRPVGRVLLDHHTRWKQGKKAVKKAIRSLKRRVDNIDAGRIDTALDLVERDFRYTILQTRFDEANNEFVVEGAMSAKRKVVRTAPKRPTENKVTIKNASEHIRVNPLVKRTAFRSAPAGDPPHWTDVQKIKTVSGRTSLYRQGHLVSGYFLGGDAWNLTPITFSANSLMATRAETPVRKKLPRFATTSSSKPVFNYDVTATGTAANGKLRERTFTKDADRVCETVTAERKLYKTITISIDAYGYNPASHKWNRPAALPPGARATQNIPNVPPFPLGQPCPKPKPKKKKKKGSK